MTVLLAGPDFEENLSIRYLSASLLDAGHKTALAAFNSSADTASVADAAEDAEIVGLSMCFQSRAKEFLHLARVIKSRDRKKIIVAGGHYASCAAGALLSHHPEIDIIVIHEGERTLVEIAGAVPHLEKRLPQIAGIAYREGQHVRFTDPRPTLNDLDALPFPDRRGPRHFIAGVRTSYLMGSRGCYGNCAYCCITTLHQLAPGKRFRQRNVERIADEMSVLYHERGTRQFVFHDDNFLVPSEAVNHARIRAFEQALKKRGIEDIALVIKCRPADANRDVLRRMKDLGLVRVFLGVESATEDGLATLERVQSVEDSVRALETCFELDISAQFTLMIFNPDATLATLRADVAFMRRFCGNPLNFCRAEIYAGTPLEKRMIALGRARGDYLAREYNLADAVADRACTVSLDLFAERCWNNGSLMQNTIGLDHTAAVARRFYGRSTVKLCRRVSQWVRSVNLDTINFLEEVLDLSASGGGLAAFQRALRDLKEREAATRVRLCADGATLRAELETLRLKQTGNQWSQLSAPHLRLARQAAAALLAIGIPATSGCGQAQDKDVKTPPQTAAAANQSQDKDAKKPPAAEGNPYYGISEMAAAPLAVPLKGQAPAQAPLKDSLCTLTGTVTDASGAVIQKGTVGIASAETGVTLRTLTTDQEGRYAVNDLPAGRYNIYAEAKGFTPTWKEHIVLKAGESTRLDFVLQVAQDMGCCEYAAAPLNTQPEDWLTKKKPFTYAVGDADDHGTFKGIAQLVYGDPGMWVQIFEANRDAIDKPGTIPYGTGILIPPRKRSVPKPISKVLPAYPAAARKEHKAGDVVLDITLKEDGTVDQVSVIDGDLLFLEPTIDAVKQWRYRPLLINGKPVLKFVVVVSFSKWGRVR